MAGWRAGDAAAELSYDAVFVSGTGYKMRVPQSSQPRPRQFTGSSFDTREYYIE